MKSRPCKGAKAQMKIPGSQMSAVTPLRLCVGNLLLILLVFTFPAFAQKTDSHSTRKLPSMSPAAKALLDEAAGVVCTQARVDPRSSIAIDEMQARPSLPVQSPEAREGAERAQRLLPIAKELVIKSLRQLSTEYGFHKSPKFEYLEKSNATQGELQAELEDARSGLSSTQSELESAKQAAETANAQRDELRTKLDEFDSLIERLRNELEQAKSQAESSESP
jgi:hypothetical protein